MVRRMTLEVPQDVNYQAEQMAPWRTRWIPRLINPVYMGTLAMTNLLFSIFMLVSDNFLIWKAKYFNCIAALALLFNTLFLFDLIMNFIVLGPTNVWKTKRFLYLELVV